MPRLPVISGKQAIEAFRKIGWKPDRHHGSHIVLIKEKSPIILSIPDHKEIRRGTLRSLIRNAGLTVEEFVALLKD
ncbi:MAG: type II toxin-antitoxin system HicA family toxin [Chloroflexi bacterium]|nr:type II toxin-antitoxin system HicA family toxin [Chloroflexota bacterium]